MNYKIKVTPDFPAAIIIIEQPHQGKRRVWGAFDEEGARLRVLAFVEQHNKDTGDFSLDTFDEAMEWNGHDLRSQTILRFEDLADNESADVVREALYFGWVVEVDEDEEE